MSGSRRSTFSKQFSKGLEEDKGEIADIVSQSAEGDKPVFDLEDEDDFDNGLAQALDGQMFTKDRESSHSEHQSSVDQNSALNKPMSMSQLVTPRSNKLFNFRNA
jgi:hypothetical protein